MIATAEVVQALHGAYRLARFDRRGFAELDLTVEGFWRSFFAAVIAVPAYVAMSQIGGADAAAQAEPATGNWLGRLVLDALAYAVGWLALPVAVHPIVRMLGRSEHYIRFVVAYNWAAVWQIGLLLLAAMVSATFESRGTGQFVTVAALLAVLVYQWFVAKAALEINGLEASGIVALDLGLGLVIGWAAGG